MVYWNGGKGRSSQNVEIFIIFNGKYNNLYANAFAKGCNFMAFLGSDQWYKDWLEIEILKLKSQFLIQNTKFVKNCARKTNGKIFYSGKVEWRKTKKRWIWIIPFFPVVVSFFY